MKKNKIETSPGNSNPVQIANTKNKVLIRIIDNIPNNLQPRGSVDIKHRIKKNSYSKIQINYTHSLPKGSIAIHFKTEEDIISFKNNLDIMYPGGSYSIPRDLDQKDKLITLVNKFFRNLSCIRFFYSFLPFVTC